MLKRAIFWGAVAAAGGAAWTLMEFALGFHGERAEVGRYTGFVSILFPILAIVCALRSARSEGGGLSFGRGLGEGMGVTLVFAVLGLLFFLLYFERINPAFLERAAAEGGASTLGGQLALLFVSSLVGGMVISLVAAALLRRPGSGVKSDG